MLPLTSTHAVVCRMSKDRSRSKSQHSNTSGEHSEQFTKHEQMRHAPERVSTHMKIMPNVKCNAKLCRNPNMLAQSTLSFPAPSGVLPIALDEGLALRLSLLELNPLRSNAPFADPNPTADNDPTLGDVRVASGLDPRFAGVVMPEVRPLRAETPAAVPLCGSMPLWLDAEPSSELTSASSKSSGVASSRTRS